jgi:hypothetical protein
VSSDKIKLEGVAAPWPQGEGHALQPPLHRSVYHLVADGVTAPPISSGSTATCAFTARPNGRAVHQIVDLRLRRRLRVVMVASSVPSALAFSVSNCALISGSRAAGRFGQHLNEITAALAGSAPATSEIKPATRSVELQGPRSGAQPGHRKR